MRLDIFAVTAVLVGVVGAAPATQQPRTTAIRSTTSTSSTTLSTSSSTTSTTSSMTTSTTSTSSTTSSTSTSTSTSIVAAAAAVAPSCASYWLEQITHQGTSAFNPDKSYKTFRNVKDFGAKGDGVTDDTAAINNAISSGSRCGPGCASTSTTPAIVYFPAGTYLISSSIIDYYYTQLIGNPNCPPVLKATPGLTGFGVIDGNQYQAGGSLAWESINVFWRQIRNFVIDMTAIPPGTGATGIHWPTAQATSLQNIVFKMSDAPGTQHVGLFIESGSGGMINDLVFYGGLKAASVGNQQFTMRNITINNAVTAIDQLWDWGWTYKSININNCTTGINIAAGGTSAQAVGSIVLFDSSITNTHVGISTAHTISQTTTSGTMILENVSLNNVPIAVQGPSSTLLAGTAGTTTIAAWGQGHSYTPSGPTNFQGPLTAFTRPASLLKSGAYFERSKPQYESLALSRFRSARATGAKGDGVTDDTAALQNTITTATQQGQVAFIDAGTYRVTNTINIPPGAKVVGEGYAVIMSSGSLFANQANPRPVVKVGAAGQQGQVEWSDMIVSTQGAQAGAILIQWNLASPSTAPSGMWDVHTRVGGFAGSNLRASNCPITPGTTITSANLKQSCIAAFMMMHISPSGTGIYLENVWLWTADHDVDDPSIAQITIYTGRGLHVESASGNIWLVGTGVEHATLYQYQFATTKSIFMGQIQSETPYYQPNPTALLPFKYNATWRDPNFAVKCAGKSGNCAAAWGLRVVDSADVLGYGAGIYSFFNNWSTACSQSGAGGCQNSIVSIEGARVRNVGLYGLNTIGSISMIDRDGASLAKAADNRDGFSETVAIFRSG
ncbi:hypothetical protein FGG08_000537 [Glutinoglossum americanum]|uniref:Rhamnogalacturonase A/B/Epimerase-like pectate lyase domain-containing protein n=1 Tax=Glutinoglossum americanum TaxID=1670608 RepID=A0A9P8L3Q0_9PEZI|nr:hypothetical protein FGG08_000537 [Glutinoglossum americanum]